RLWVERRVKGFFSDIELRFFLAVVALATAAILASLLLGGGIGFADALRLSLFQVSSIISTTGFITADFEAWHPFAQQVLLLLMFIGGSTGSTAGGLKASRILLLLKVTGREFKRLVERR